MVEDVDSQHTKVLRADLPDAEPIAADLDNPFPLECFLEGVDIMFGIASFELPESRSVLLEDSDQEFSQGKGLANTAIKNQGRRYTGD